MGINNERTSREQGCGRFAKEEKVDNSDDAAELITKIDKMIKNKKNIILTLAYQQGIIFRKLKTNTRFTSAVSELKISKATINFKIDIVKFIDKYPKM